MMTRFILDSGDPDEYREISSLAKAHNSELWGGTTNPTLIAKKLSGKNLSKDEAFSLQKQIVMEILDIVPGAVSAEVYADLNTSAEDMAGQGREIATWHERAVVKLPTTPAGFKARTMLRKEKIPVNNTLVFSQEQIFAICLHEKLCQEEFGPITDMFPPFISPFVGRLDDIGEDGMFLAEQGMRLKEQTGVKLWMLVASVRRLEHVKRGFELNCDLITIPAKIFRDWFAKSDEEQKNIDPKKYSMLLKQPDAFDPQNTLRSITTLAVLQQALDANQLNIQHPLTDKGLTRFAQDWQALLNSE